MSEIGNYIDGRGLLTKSPLRSGYFLTVSASCLGSVLLTAYIILRHWHTLNGNVIALMATFIGVHSFYQLWRALRYYSRMRVLYEAAASEQPRDGSSLDVALRTAAGGMNELLFYHFGMVLMCLVVIDFLLFRLDGLK